jgi:hypothetical protein
MDFDVRKTTLADYNHGATALTFTNLGNSRYKGTTVCWEVINLDAQGEFDESVCALSRKRDAEGMAEYLTKIGYCLVGDPVAIYRSYLRDKASTPEDWEELDKLREV